MSYKKIVKLKDGVKVQLKSIGKKENALEFQRFINQLTKEGTYLLVDKPITIKQERLWLKDQISAQRKGQQMFIKAIVDGRIVGDCFARPGFGRNKGNINLGIAIKKQFRGKGLGKIMLKELILLSEEKWHPKNIFLHVVSSNKNALSLYESLGFKKIACLPKWFEYHGKYLDEIVLILDKKYFRKKYC